MSFDELRPPFFWGSSIFNIPVVPAPDQDGITIKELGIGVSRRMHNGYLRIDVIDRVFQITLKWSALPSDLYDALRSCYDLYGGTPTDLGLPDGRTFKVMCSLNAWSESLFWVGGITPVWDVTIEFEETRG